MDNATMQRLVMDRSLGALDPVVSALLDAYLQTQPQWAQQARQLDDTVTLARSAMGKPAARLPLFPSQRLAQAQTQLRWRRGLTRLVAVAASVVLGIALGFAWFGRGNAPSPAAGPAAAAAPATPLLAEKPAPADSDGLWSVHRLQRLAAAQAAAAPAVQINLWQKPQMGNDL